MISGVGVGDGGGVIVAVGTSVGKKKVGVEGGCVGLAVGVGISSTLTHPESSSTATVSPKAAVHL
jgi:hypothetical protein